MTLYQKNVKMAELWWKVCHVTLTEQKCKKNKNGRKKYKWKLEKILLVIINKFEKKLGNLGFLEQNVKVVDNFTNFGLSDCIKKILP